MRKKRSKITVFAILTTITILVWIFAEAYQRLKKTELTTIPEAILAPIAPSLDRETLDNMEKRLWFSQNPSAPPIVRSEPEITVPKAPSETE